MHKSLSKQRTSNAGNIINALFYWSEICKRNIFYIFIFLEDKLRVNDQSEENKTCTKIFQRAKNPDERTMKNRFSACNSLSTTVLAIWTINRSHEISQKNEIAFTGVQKRSMFLTNIAKTNCGISFQSAFNRILEWTKTRPKLCSRRDHFHLMLEFLIRISFYVLSSP